MRRFTLAQIALRLCADFPRALGRRRQIDSSAARFRQSDGDRLLHIGSAVHTFPHVIDLFAHEFARLRRGRLPFASILPRSFQGLLIVAGRHRDCSCTDSVMGCKKIWRGEVGNRPSPHALLSQGTQLPFLPFAVHCAGGCGSAKYGLVPKAHGKLLYVREFPTTALQDSSDWKWINSTGMGGRGYRFSAATPFWRRQTGGFCL